jgi:hypothetical protein
MHMTAEETLTHTLRKLTEEMALGLVPKLMDRIKPQAIKAIVAQPHKRVVDQELANESAVFAFEIERRSPSCRMAISEEALGIAVQIVQLRAEWL